MDAVTSPRVVIDTDAFNEIDDQFAIAWALLIPDRLGVEALYAAPFHNEKSVGPGDGMRKSLDEIGRVLETLNGPSPETFAGSRRFLTGGGPIPSPAAEDLIARAHTATPEDPVHVIAIGAPTNVASALQMDPSIAATIRVLWLGGHAFDWPKNDEFNLRQDIDASRVILKAIAPTTIIPCNGVASHLSTTLAEVSTHLDQARSINRLLTRRLAEVRDDHVGYSRVIWDLAPVAALALPEAVPTVARQAPRLGDDLSWLVDAPGPTVHVARHVDRNAIFRDLFDALNA